MSKTADLRIEILGVDQLQEYENNARQHGEIDIAAIKDSIETFGFNDPIGIWSEDNVIVEGHGRLAAAKDLGMAEVPCIRLDHMTDEERRAYALAHNKTAELSGWDYENLDVELMGIEGIDMSQFGFEPVTFETDDEEGEDEEALDDVDRMERHYGVPYQGNKSRIADLIISALPDGRRLVDLFGGVARSRTAPCFQANGTATCITT